VRVEGLEPPRREAPEPKSGVSANFTIPAYTEFYQKASANINDCGYLSIFSWCVFAGFLQLFSKPLFYMAN
jgi:hypothetical protein